MTQSANNAVVAGDVTIRRGAEADAEIIAYHRACMFRDMGRFVATNEMRIPVRSFPET